MIALGHSPDHYRLAFHRDKDCSCLENCLWWWLEEDCVKVSVTAQLVAAGHHF
jgi:hypothetical protein